MDMRDVVYMGNMDRVAEYILYNDGFNLIAIICEPGRIHDDLLTFSLFRNIPLIEINNAVELKNEMAKYNEQNTIFISCSFCLRVPMEQLGSNYKVFNLHYAELPQYKGRHADHWATMMGEKYMGVSLHIITDKFDDGDIIAVEKIPYYFWEDNRTVNNKQTECTKVLLDKLVNYLETGYIEKKNVGGEYYRAITNQDKIIDLSKDSPADILNKARTQAMYRGAAVIIKESMFFLKELRFTKRKIEKDFIIEGDSLLIKYNDEICIISNEYYYGYSNE